MNRENIYRAGIDIGSTTVKVVVLDCAGTIVHKVYRRHKAAIDWVLTEELGAVVRRFPEAVFTVGITGSAGMGIAERTGIPFVQEVVASIEVIKQGYPDIRTMIDLGGEDAKMVFFESGRQPDIRMNGSCAGGTGAFIDQMADLMHLSADELGDRALHYEKIHPVASRCGVFAKTDVQNLISRNVPAADVAMSILHTVALQSITTLARGHEMKPRILCIGGPLTYLPALRNSFRDLLKAGDGDLIVPDNSAFFPAWGTALYRQKEQTVQDLPLLVGKLKGEGAERKDALPPLFADEAAYRAWQRNRKVKPLRRVELGEKKRIDCFLGIDSGSTTTKILITDEAGNIVFTFYSGNEGHPLKKVVEGLEKFRTAAAEKGVTFRFLSSAATGYGEDLIKSALALDYGIVETMAHLSGAQYADPEVSFVLDIGGQDMKSIFTHKGVISNIELNEACSSGCGSFLQNFAATMNMSLADFMEAACLSRYPADLGSRCTVFMNSKVKQSLRENAAMGDIAAGLAYSVVKNCLFKVLKIANLNRLGEHIVVQGGTFRNDAVYRALELLSGKSVSSTDSPELMGALGAALYARKMWTANRRQTAFTGAEALPDAEHTDTKELQCGGCTNQCSVLRFRFGNGNTCYAGNKCEKVFYNKGTAGKKGYNAFNRKNELLFDRRPRKEPSAGHPTIGIPRVLNMFENYPFWHTLFTECGFEVLLSPESTFSLYQSGVGSVMSDNICFPAKLVHGHILALAKSGVDRIFYPMVIREEKEFEAANESFNCPVVSGYPDVIRSAMEPEEKYGIPFDKPVVTFGNSKSLEKACFAYLSSLGVSKQTFAAAFAAAMQERRRTNNELRDTQRERLDSAVRDKEPVFITAGRPYHTDPLIHQKVGQILSDLGVHVLTDDVFRRDAGTGFGKLNIVSQWSYPNRTVQAAMETAKLPQNVQLVQLNSFGCGPDSFFMNEISDILKQAGKNHTVLRIDEIAAPGSVRLRLRSLIESLRVMPPSDGKEVPPYNGYERTYTEADRRKTILVPWFSDFISPFVPAIGELAGYKMENLPRSSKASAEAGLKYGHNEVCYPSTLVLGDILTALQSGEYDLDNTVVAITQTGGQCRATNYLSQIKSAMKIAGFSHIPVVVLTSGEAYRNEQKAFRVPVMKFINILIYAILYADALQQMYSAAVVREQTKGEARQLFDLYIGKGVEAVKKNDRKTLLALLKQAVAAFNSLPVHQAEYTKIGLIGEIYVKYNDYGQAHITDWLRANRMEVVTPPTIDFLTQYFVNSDVYVHNGVERNTLAKRLLNPLFRNFINTRIKEVGTITNACRFLTPAESIDQKALYASDILDLSNQFGEGWMIAAEVACYARAGIDRVVCIQPFGCIANHIVAKGIEKRIKKFYPKMNLLCLDIDNGTAEVNLQNRLHFLIEGHEPAMK
ncbi:2-hydroxyglutaryl-CoA dehydratase component A [Bacteroidales bacterium Barb6]|nr:2-hydroxyglutaryl-CoA dehydratase component A [Bacteroidales bacterium Barb6]